MNKFLLLFIILQSLYLTSVAQLKHKPFKWNIPTNTFSDLDEDNFFFAEELYELENYFEANKIYANLFEKYPEAVFLKYKTGVSYILTDSKLDEATKLIEESYQADSLLEHSTLFLGKAYHLNYRFDDAIKYYNKYLASIKPNSKNKIIVDEVSALITQCNSGMIVTQEPKGYIVKNIGDPVNTEGSEYVPLIKTDESFMIYTYVGPRSKGGLLGYNLNPDPSGNYYEDIFTANKSIGVFENPQPIEGNLNSSGNDACIGISPDGEQLFLFKSSKKNGGDIYVSNYHNNMWSDPIELGDAINTKYWEGSSSITADKKTLYFSSERPGGFGGRDIYESKLTNKGIWGPAKNLGPNVNTLLDDDAPFIHPDGRTLYFSSQGHNSIGGYDVFKTIRDDNTDQFNKSENIGTPVNTPSDDKYFITNASAITGYYSSGRKDSKGLQDIYSIDLTNQENKPIVALIKGIVTANGQPVAATIEIKNVTTKSDFQPVTANSSSGSYLITISPDDKYQITYSFPGYEPYSEFVDTKSITEYVYIVKDITLSTEKSNIDTASTLEYAIGKRIIELKMLRAANDRNNSSAAKELMAADDDVISPPIDSTSKNNNLPVETLKNNENNLENLLKKYENKTIKNDEYYAGFVNDFGTLKNPQIIYKVQIGAYRNPKNFKYTNVKSKYGNADVIDYPDGITRFTLREYSNIAEAEIFRKQMLAEGITDAWITAFIDSKRYTLTELVRNKFFMNNK